MITSDVPEEIWQEIARQDLKWANANDHTSDDRWCEIAEDEWRDLRHACRTRMEVPGHTIAKERAQLVAVLIRWAVATK